MIIGNSKQVTEEIEDNLEISLIQVFPGSFNVHLVSPEPSQLNILRIMIVVVHWSNYLNSYMQTITKTNSSHSSHF